MNTITDKQISEYLDTKNIAHHNKGYVYLMTGIRMLLENQADRGHVVLLYEAIAAKHNTRSNYVERAIRHTIKKTEIKVSNKEFITLALDHLILSHNE